MIQRYSKIESVFAALLLVALVGCGNAPASNSQTDNGATDIGQDSALQDTFVTDASPGADTSPNDVTMIDATSPLDAGSTTCAVFGDCKAPLPVCDFADGLCVACLQDGDCSEGSVCLGKACTAAIACTSDKECAASDAVCDKDAGQCVDCLSDGDCTGEGRICKLGHCVAKPPTCASSKECAAVGGVCNKTTGTCAECTSADDCLDERYCKQGVCVPDLCKAGQTQCKSPTELSGCNTEGSGFESWECQATEACYEGACKLKICTPGHKVCTSEGVKSCNARGVGFGAAVTCKSDEACHDGACLPKVCTPGETTCKDAVLATCEANGTAWASSKCKASVPGALGEACGTADGNAACVPMVCAPKSLVCAGTQPAICNDDGLGSTPSGDCKVLPNGGPGTCAGGVCLPEACTGTATSCAGALVVGCQDSVWTASSCAAGEGCKDGACEKVVCIADEIYCAGTVRLQCDKSGTSPATLQDCAADGKTCKDGACVPTVCKPGSVLCSDDGSATETCNALGLGTVKLACPSQHTCVGGSCLPVVCEPTTAFCSGSDAVQCDKTGTSTTTLESCKAGSTCKDGACFQWLCTPGATECSGDQLATCNSDGLGKTINDCPSGEICDGLGCKKIVCEPQKKACEGTKAGQCNGKGTGWVDQQDCTANKLFCIDGACVDQLCKPNEVACAGTAVGTCQADGLGWKSKVECDDSDACTSNGCKDGACFYGAPKVCDDNEPCTDDLCDKASGNCLATPKTGSCDDGSLCTPDDTCKDGKCQAGPGMVGTWAGSGTAGFLDGSAASARFYYPEAIVTNAAGTSYIADSYNHRIRIVDSNGTTTTLAGNGSTSYAEGTGTTALFYRPSGLALAGSTLYVADTWHHRVRAIDLQTKKSQLLAGNGSASYQNATGELAKFYYPQGLALTPGGQLLVADRGNHCIRGIAASGVVTTFAGTNAAGFADGAVTVARFKSPYGIAVDKAGVVYVADTGNHRIRRIQSGTVTTIAGSGSSKVVDGLGAQASFYNPKAIVIAPDGTLFLADYTGQTVRTVTPTGTVKTIAGSSAGMLDGPLSVAKFYYPSGISLTSGGDLLLTDRNNHRLRRIAFGPKDCDDGAACTTDACDPKTGACNHTPLTAGKPCDDGDSCTVETACDAKGACAGKLKDCDDNNPCTTDTCDGATGTCGHQTHDEACDDGDACSLGDACVGGLCKAEVGTIAAVAGNGTAAIVDGAVADARLYGTVGVAERPDGSLAIAEQLRVRLLSADGKTVSTLAGPSTNESGTVKGYGQLSRFVDLRALQAWPDGSLRVADAAQIVRVGSDGYTTLLAGAADNSAGYIDGKGDAARFSGIRGVARRADGGLVISEETNRRIRLLLPNGMVSTLAGSGLPGYQDGPVSSAMFNTPRGVAVGSDGAIYVADAGNRRVRKIVGATVSTVAGSGQSGTQDGAASSASFPDLWGLAALPGGRVAIATGAALRLYDPANNGAISTLLADGNAPFAGFGVAVGLHVAKGKMRSLAAGSDDRLWAVDPAHQVRVLRFGTAACDDGSPCTTDVCDKQKGCTHAAKAKGSACDDGTKCTDATACDDKGQCVGATKNCDDGNICSVDACDPDLGSCTHDPSLGSCDDGSACTIGEACSGGVCSSQPLILQTLVGVVDQGGYVDGPGPDARCSTVGGIAVGDSDVIFADTGNHLIRRYAAGKVTTLAGTPTTKGFQDGAASSAKFDTPRGLAARADGTIIVADGFNHRLRLIAKGDVTTWAGSSAGYIDGPVAASKFNEPRDVLIDKAGRTWVADYANQRIRRILVSGTVETAAGSTAGFQDGAPTSARFSGPHALAMGPDGASIYVAEDANRRIRKIAPDGTVSTVLGNGKAGIAQVPTIDGPIGAPAGLAFDSTGALLVSIIDGPIRLVLRVDGGKVSHYLGLWTKSGKTDGIPGVAQMSVPSRIARGPGGSLWFGDAHALRAVPSKAKNCDDGSPCTTDACDAKTGACSNTKLATGSACTDGTACTTADACDANGQCVGKVKDCSDGNVCTADYCEPFDGACSHPIVDGPCDDGSVCTSGEACALGSCQVGPGMVETIAGDGAAGFADGTALAAKMQTSLGIVVRKDGSVVFADAVNHRIRQLAGGKVTTIAGDGVKGYIDGKGLSARLFTPGGMDERADGSIVFFDQENARIRALAPDGTVSTLAGSGQAGMQDGFPTSASFSTTGSITVQGDQTWVIDTGNHRIRTLAKDGTVATAAGSVAGFVDGPAATARFSTPMDAAVSGGALFVTDHANNRIRKVADGLVTTVAGKGLGTADGPFGTATLNHPVGITAAQDGSLWFGCGQYDRRVRRLSTSGFVSTIAGSGKPGGADGFTTAATFATTHGLAWQPGAGAIVGDIGRLRLVRSPSKSCDDEDNCTVDTCDAKTGACTHSPTADGGACSVDSKACTEGMTCKSGICQGGTTKDCNDNDACTDDSCDAATGTCVHTVNGGPSCCQPTIFEDTFDGPAKAWDFSNSVGPTKGWQVWQTATTSQSGSGVLYYGDPATKNFHFGKSSGEAKSPTFAIPAGATTTLEFWLYLDVEGGTSYDKLVVTAYSGSANTTVYKKTGNVLKKWFKVTADLSSFPSNAAYVAFNFDTIDHVANNGLGVLVDGFKVTRSCGAGAP